MIQQKNTPYENDDETDCLDSQQEEKLLAALVYETTTWKQERRMFRNLTIANVLLEAGLRVNEVVSLRIPDLWFSDNPVSTLVVRSEIAKGGRQRKIPVSPRLSMILQQNHEKNWQYCNAYPNGFAFSVQDPEKQITTRSVERTIADVGIRALGISITPHMLRHTFASRVLEKSNLEVVRRLLGHRNIQTTQRYVHASADQLRIAVEASSRKETPC